MTVKFFKVTGSKWKTPMYYAAYDVKNAKLYAYDTNNSQFLLEFTEVTFDDIPAFDSITCAGLEFMDAQNVIQQEINRMQVWQAS